MDQPAAVDGVERVRQLRGDVEQAIPRQRPAREHVVERPSLEQLADQERLAVFLARIVHRADVRMGDQRGDARLAPEALASPRDRGDFLGPKQLDGDVAIEPQVARPIDLAGAVAADGLEKLVVRDPHVVRRASTVPSRSPAHRFDRSGRSLRAARVFRARR